MNKFFKACAAAVTAAALFSGMPVLVPGVGTYAVTAYAASEGTLSDTVSYTLDGRGTLTINGTGVVPQIDNGELKAAAKIIVVEDGITELGDSCFINFYNVTEVKLPSSLQTIGDDVFTGCEALTLIEIPNSVTSIGSVAFNGCFSLKSIKLPDSITSIGYGVFGSCSSLTSIELPNSITSIGDAAFADCSSLTSIKLPESITSIGREMFYYCSSLKSIELPNSVTSIGDAAFVDCSSLTSIELPDGLTSIGSEAFQSCSSLTLIEIPNSVTSIGNAAFADCSRLTSIKLPDGLTSIGFYTFQFCSGLTSIEIPNSVTRIGNAAFADCSSLTSIELPDSITGIGSVAFGSCNRLTSIELPTGLRAVGADVFDNCNNLNEIIYRGTKEDLESIQGVSAGFYEKTVQCNNGDYIVTGISGTYEGVSYELKDGVLTLTGSGVLPQQDFLSFSKHINKIVVGEGFTELGSYCFCNLYNVTEVVFPSTLKTIGDFAFLECFNLKSIKIPVDVAAIGEAAFYECSRLSSVRLAAGTNVSQDTFSGCSEDLAFTVEGTRAEAVSLEKAYPDTPKYFTKAAAQELEFDISEATINKDAKAYYVEETVSMANPTWTVRYNKGSEQGEKTMSTGLESLYGGVTIGLVVYDLDGAEIEEVDLKEVK